jgi:hypothetical protein
MKNKDLLTVGDLAKLMNVTVRTLQYYDKEGLLTPSSSLSLTIFRIVIFK